MSVDLSPVREVVDDPELDGLLDELEANHKAVEETEAALREARSRREEAEQEVERLRSQAERVEQEAGRSRLVLGSNPTATMAKARKRVEALEQRAEELESELEDRLEAVEEAETDRRRVAEKTARRLGRHAREALEEMVEAWGRLPTADRPIKEIFRDVLEAAKPLANLRTICRWAAGKRVGKKGSRRLLLESDPTRGLDLVPDDVADPEPDRTQLTYSDAECKALLEVADRVVLGRTDRDGNTVSYMPALLTLAMKTGRRISSIIALKRSDWRPDAEGAEHGEIRWRADEDKVNANWTTPVLPSVRQALQRQRLKADPDRPWLFPAPRSVGHVSRHLVGDWLGRAKKLTREADGVDSVEHVHGRGWHGFRRRWAIKRKHLPVQDVAQLGGWKTIETLQQIYQQPDNDSMQQALKEGEERSLAL